ncbi:MAG: hypothetical protein ACI8QZ_000326 [Chlamydiales bacterium]|jgi:hypothetical protein
MTHGEPDPGAYEMLVHASFAPSAIDARYEAVLAPVPPELRRTLEAEWPGRVEKAAREGVHLTNGHLLRLTDYRATDSTLRLTLGDTTYAEFLGSNCVPQRHAETPWSSLANPLGTSALIVTADNKLVLGLRGDKVMHMRNQLHTIGGMFEAADLIDGVVDATGSILREVREELGVGDTDIANVVCRGLIREIQHLQPELMFEVQVNLTYADVQDTWRAAESRDEHAQLIAIRDDRDSIAEFLASNPIMAPQARAALELRGA